ncbi:MAG: B12-binding domain-containing radical SAM protein, partial [Candidatus Eisenbacteria bacterium]|nr:B12-binding domain-containing radical SAM protein [Candidatus Eisenbacteria bacterium]
MKRLKKRIGLIAMSGIRAQNAELLEAGLTLPGFVERSKVIASLPSLSLLTLAGMTPKEFEVEYHEIQDLNLMETLPTNFDLVAITSLSAQIFDAYKVASRYRKLNIPVVMGGLHVTAVPHEAKQYCDSVVVGEGEPSWPELLRDFARGQLQPFYYGRTHGEFDLSLAPVPRFDLLDPDKYNRLTVQTSRGCPHKCTFCASSILLTPKYKLKPVDKVIEEIHTIKSVWSKPFIEFADDNSFVHRGHYKKLLRHLAKENVRWFTECDVSVAEDDELLGLMRDSGCQQVLIGLESPTREGLEDLEGNSNWKAKRQDRYLEAIHRIQSQGITVNGCFILGLDTDTPEVFDRVRDFVLDANLYEVQITFLTPFPGTPLYSQLDEQGRVLEPGNWDLCTLFD